MTVKLQNDLGCLTLSVVEWAHAGCLLGRRWPHKLELRGQLNTDEARALADGLAGALERLPEEQPDDAENVFPWPSLPALQKLLAFARAGGFTWQPTGD